MRRAWVRFLGVIVCAGVAAAEVRSTTAADAVASPSARPEGLGQPFAPRFRARPSYRLSNGRTVPPSRNRQWPGELQAEHPDYPRSYRGWMLRSWETNLAVTNLFNSLKELRSFRAQLLKERAGQFAVCGKLDQAFADLQTLVDEGMDDADTIRLRGAFHFAAGNIAQAKADCTRALALDATLTNARLVRAFCLSRVQNWHEAIQDIDDALTTNDKDPQLHYQRGLLLMKQGRVVEAVVAFDRAIVLDPTDAMALDERAGAHDRLGNESQASKDRQQAAVLRANATRQPTFAVRIQLHERIEVEHKLASAGPPTTAQQHADRAVWLTALGQPERAIDAATQAIAVEPTNAQFYRDRSIAAIVLQRTDDAIGDITRAIDLTHDRIVRESYETSLGLLHETENSIRCAVRTLDFVLHHQPRNASALSLRGVAHYKLGQSPEAAADLCAAIELDGHAAGLRLNRAAFYVQIERWREALADLEFARAIEPSHPAIYHLKAEALCGLERWAEAKIAIERAMALDPTDPDHWLRRSAIHLVRGDLAAWARDVARAKKLQADAIDFRRSQYSWAAPNRSSSTSRKQLASAQCTQMAPPVYPGMFIPMSWDSFFLSPSSLMPAETIYADEPSSVSTHQLGTWAKRGAQSSVGDATRHLLSLESRKAFAPPYRSLTGFVVVPKCDVIEGAAFLIKEEPGWQPPVRSVRQLPLLIEELVERDGEQVHYCNELAIVNPQAGERLLVLCVVRTKDGSPIDDWFVLRGGVVVMDAQATSTTAD